MATIIKSDTFIESIKEINESFLEFYKIESENNIEDKFDELLGKAYNKIIDHLIEMDKAK